MKELQDYQQPANVTDFLAQVGVDPSIGLSREEGMTRRELYGPNRVTPPVNCPSWVCCLLPCLLRTSSMQAYHAVLPKEATVRRRMAAGGKVNSRLLRMDAASLVYGDVVEVKANEVIPADLRVVECSPDCVVDQTSLFGDSSEDDDFEDGGNGLRKMVCVDSSSSYSSGHESVEGPIRSGNILLMATRLLQGKAMGVVISTGDHTLWGQLLSEHKWPMDSTKIKKVSEKQALIGKNALIV